jgi:hypothetical protein
MNDVNVMDLEGFVKSDGANLTVNSTKLEYGPNQVVPSTRWGHAAAVFDNRLFILGGRNEQDITDLYSF